MRNERIFFFIISIGVLSAATPAAFAQQRLFETGAPSNEYVGFQAPASITTSILWTLPSADGSTNQCLVTNGSGTLSWANAPSPSWPLLAPNGSAGAPSYSFSGSTGTGVWAPANGLVAISTGGSERLRIDGSGVIGIGVTTPSARLAQKMDIAASADYGGMALTTWSAAHQDHSSILDFNRSKSSTIGTHTAVVVDDTLGNIDFRGSDGSAFKNSAMISSAADGTVSTNVVPGRLTFWTTDAAGALTERMRITKSGNVGIGTSSPSSRLTVHGSDVALAIGDATGAGASPSGLQFLDVGNKHVGFRFDGTRLIYEGASNSNLPSTWNVGAETADFIIRNGKLGLGITNPTNKVEIYDSTAITSGNHLNTYINTTVNPPSAASTANSAGFQSLISKSGTQDFGSVFGIYGIGQNGGTGTLGEARGGVFYGQNAGAGNVTNAYGITSYAASAGTGSVGTAYGIYAHALRQSGSMTAAYGSGNFATNATTGTLSSGYGALAQVLNTSTGTITTAVGLNVDLYNPSGTVSSYYGLLVNDEGQPNSNYWSIYTGTTKSYFGGAVGIKNANPNATLDVQGPVIFNYAGSGYDVWIQGGNSLAGGTARNLALLGNPSNDTLWVNYNSEYAGGTWIGSPTYLQSPGNSAGFGAYCYDSSFQITYAASCTASDARLKKNVNDLPLELDNLLQLRPVSYEWIDPKRGAGEKVGLIAQEVEKIYPQVVDTNGDGFKSINYDYLTSPIIKAVQDLYHVWFNDSQELHAKIDKLEKENADLKSALCEINPNAKVCR